MTKCTQLGVLVLVVGLLVLGCKHKPEMTVRDVIQLANQAAQNAGYDLANYQDPEAHFEFTRRDHTWYVSYRPKEQALAIPGFDFSVTVDDRTRKTRLFHGM